MHIAVDLMGSDTSPEQLYQGVLQAHEALKGKFELTALGTLEVKEAVHSSDSPIKFRVADEEVLMDESPLWVVRKKQNSSMAVGIKLLKNKEVDAFVSAGNTGAITAFSSLELNKLPGISRPALLTELPTQLGHAAILDVGANVSYRPESFFEYALMGAAYQKEKRNLIQPKVGLLNIGVEVRKGTQKIRSAYQYFCEKKELLEKENILFEGNIESRDLFKGQVDVLVTDGFTGNVFLKTCEGVSSFILEEIHKRLRRAQQNSFPNRFFGLEKYLDYAEYPGAVLIGVEGVVVKCHGSSSSLAMLNGIKGASYLLQKQLIEKIKKHLLHYKNQLK